MGLEWFTAHFFTLLAFSSHFLWNFEENGTLKNRKMENVGILEKWTIEKWKTLEFWKNGKLKNRKMEHFGKPYDLLE